MRNFYIDSQCPKCGEIDARVIYHMEVKNEYLNFRLTNEEHMLRICRICGYNWAEKPLS